MSYHSHPLEGQTNQTEGSHQGNAVLAITEILRRKEAIGTEGLEKVKILPDTDRYFQIGSNMEEGDKIKVLLLLIQNVDVFPGSI